MIHNLIRLDSDQSINPKEAKQRLEALQKQMVGGEEAHDKHATDMLCSIITVVSEVLQVVVKSDQN